MKCKKKKDYKKISNNKKLRKQKEFNNILHTKLNMLPELEQKEKELTQSTTYKFSLAIMIIKPLIHKIYYNSKYRLRYNGFTKFVIWNFSHKKTIVNLLRIIASLGLISQLWSLIVRDGITYNGLMLLINLITTLFV